MQDSNSPATYKSQTLSPSCMTHHFIVGVTLTERFLHFIYWSWIFSFKYILWILAVVLLIVLKKSRVSLGCHNWQMERNNWQSGKKLLYIIICSCMKCVIPVRIISFSLSGSKSVLALTEQIMWASPLSIRPREI